MVKKGEKKATEKEVVKEPKIKLEDIFDFDLVGHNKPQMQELKSYYTKVKRGIKHAKGKVCLLTLKEFWANCLGHTNREDVDITKVGMTNPELVKQIKANKLRRKFALPLIDVTRKKSLGTGRALACHLAGIKKVPVFICGEPEEMEAFIQEKSFKEYK